MQSSRPVYCRVTFLTVEEKHSLTKVIQQSPALYSIKKFYSVGFIVGPCCFWAQAKYKVCTAFPPLAPHHTPQENVNMLDAASIATCRFWRLWLSHLFVQRRRAHQLIIQLRRVFLMKKKKKVPGTMLLISCLSELHRVLRQGG